MDIIYVEEKKYTKEPKELANMANACMLFWTDPRVKEIRDELQYKCDGDNAMRTGGHATFTDYIAEFLSTRPDIVEFLTQKPQSVESEPTEPIS